MNPIDYELEITELLTSVVPKKCINKPKFIFKKFFYLNSNIILI